MRKLQDSLNARRFVRTAVTLLGSLATAQIARADVADEQMASQSGGFGKWVIDSIFEAGSITSMPDSPGWIGNAIMPFSMVAMIVATIIIVGKSIQHLLIVAQAKDPNASPVSMTWAPLHLVFAVVVIMPMPSGYSLGQYGALWIGEQSNLLGNLVSERVATYVGNKGTITTPPVPEVQDYIKAAVSGHSCRFIYNSQYDALEQYTGEDKGRIEVIENFYVNAYRDASISYDTRRVGFRQPGWFIGDNYFCGEAFIGVKEHDEGEVRLSGLCPEGINMKETPSLCGPITHSKRAEAMGDALNEQNVSLAKRLGAIGVDSGSNGVSVIARDIFYDVPALLSTRLADEPLSSEEMQGLSSERQTRLERAVDRTIQMYTNTQTRAYAGYAQAVRNTNQTGDNGEDWLDKVYEQGWPVFGLYWFQMTTTNKRVLESASFISGGTSDLSLHLRRFGKDTDDVVLARMLEARWKQYIDMLEDEIRNTALDPVVTGVNEYDRDGNLKVSGAQAIEKLHDGILDELKEISADGSMEADGLAERVTNIFNSFVKGTMFPMVLDSLRGDGNIVSGMVNTGHWIIAAQEALYLIDLHNRSAHAASNWNMRKQQRDAQANEANDNTNTAEEQTLKDNTDMSWTPDLAENWIIDRASPVVFGTIGGQMVVNSLKDFMKVMNGLLFVGLFMAFYIPAVVLIQWMIGIVTWMIYLVEAIIVLPLWGLLFVSDMGSQSLSPQSARQGLVHLLSILFYPALMVIGFVVGIKIIDVISIWFVDIMEIGINQFTEGFTFGIVSLAAGLVIVGFASYQVITRVFSLVLEFNQRMMNWIGQYNNYGEHNVEGQVRQGFVAFMYQGRSATAGAQQQNQKTQARNGSGQGQNR